MGTPRAIPFISLLSDDESDLAVVPSTPRTSTTPPTPLKPQNAPQPLSARKQQIAQLEKQLSQMERNNAWRGELLKRLTQCLGQMEVLWKDGAKEIMPEREFIIPNEVKRKPLDELETYVEEEEQMEGIWRKILEKWKADQEMMGLGPGSKDIVDEVVVVEPGLDTREENVAQVEGEAVVGSSGDVEMRDAKVTVEEAILVTDDVMNMATDVTTPEVINDFEVAPRSAKEEEEQQQRFATQTETDAEIARRLQEEEEQQQRRLKTQTEGDAEIARRLQ